MASDEYYRPRKVDGDAPDSPAAFLPELPRLRRTTWVSGVSDGIDVMVLEDRQGSGACIAVVPDEDPVWSAVSALIRAEFGVVDEARIAAKLHRAFPLTVDGNEDRRFGFEMSKVCADGYIARGWGPVNPPQLRDIEVPVATHEAWDRLTAAQQLELVGSVIR